MDINRERAKVTPGIDQYQGTCKIEFTNELDRRDFITFLDKHHISYSYIKSLQISNEKKLDRTIRVNYCQLISWMIDSMPVYERVVKDELPPSPYTIAHDPFIDQEVIDFIVQTGPKDIDDPTRGKGLLDMLENPPEPIKPKRTTLKDWVEGIKNMKWER